MAQTGEISLPCGITGWNLLYGASANIAQCFRRFHFVKCRIECLESILRLLRICYTDCLLGFVRTRHRQCAEIIYDSISTMPLNIRVKSDRQDSRPGETYRATIELANTDDFEVVYVVEGVAVTCHGVEVLDPGWISPHYYSNRSGPPYRKDKRRIVRSLFSAHANQILERLLFLAPQQEKHFSVACCLPDKLPPSFKGTSVRYVYELCVHVKYRKGAYGARDTLKKSVEKQEPHRLSFRQPFCVYPDYLDSMLKSSKSTDEVSREDIPVMDVCFRSEDEVMLQWSEASDDDKTSSTDDSNLSRGISESVESSSTANLALRLGMAGSAADSRSLSRFSVSRSSLPETEMSYQPPLRHRTNSSLTHAEAQLLVGICVHPQMFNLRFGNETVVLFSFNPLMSCPLRPGSMLGGVLRLSGMVEKNGHHQQQNWSCQSYTVTLETEEEVVETWQRDTAQDKRVIRRLHCEHTEFTGDVLMTNFMFTIPSNAPPSFRTPLLSLRWVLKFEFEVGRCQDWMEMGEVQPTSNDTEPLLWQLPLTVYPRY